MDRREESSMFVGKSGCSIWESSMKGKEIHLQTQRTLLISMAGPQKTLGDDLELEEMLLCRVRGQWEFRRHGTDSDDAVVFFAGHVSGVSAQGNMHSGMQCTLLSWAVAVWVSASPLSFLVFAAVSNSSARSQLGALHRSFQNSQAHPNLIMSLWCGRGKQWAPWASKSPVCVTEESYPTGRAWNQLWRDHDRRLA